MAMPMRGVTQLFDGGELKLKLTPRSASWWRALNALAVLRAAAIRGYE